MPGNIPTHEQRLADLAREAGFTQVSASHAVSPLLRLVPRGDTTVVDAYLSPILRRYVDQVAAELTGTRLYFMQSNGGLTEAHGFQGKDAILSGPAGGIVGAARTAGMAGLDQIIGFDMGGTSTDVALYAGAFERAFETAVAGVRMRAPMMAINTVAAGGGSILHFDGARMRVGPDSAGANPGPACYRRGGPLTVTDANVCVGKIQPAHFPPIFGPHGDQPLDAEVVAAEIRRTWPSEIGGDRQHAAAGRRGLPAHRRRQHGQRDQAGLGAEGPRRQPLRPAMLRRRRRPARLPRRRRAGHGDRVHPSLCRRAVGLRHGPRRPDRDAGTGGRDAARAPTRCRSWRPWPTSSPPMPARDAASPGRRPRRRRPRAQPLHLRYAGTEAALIVPLRDLDTIVADFTAAHRARFGFATPDRAVVVETVAVEATLPGDRRAETRRCRRARRARRNRSTACASSPAARARRRPGVRPHRAAAPATASPARRWSARPTPPP